MRPLIIGEVQTKEIARVKDHAEKNRHSMEILQSRMEKELPPPGDDPDFVCFIPSGFKCVFTVEQHPMGWCRHLSVSVDDPEKLPSVPAVEMLMREFGFRGGLRGCVVYKEEAVRPFAINVIQKITEN